MFDDAEYDAPVFKRLARNDTPAAPGKQDGPLIPVDIKKYFPELPGTVSAARPTRQKFIQAELVKWGEWSRRARVRYQLQTRGGKRAPEYRITQLGSLLLGASAGDYLICQRSRFDPRRYRLVFVAATELAATGLATAIGGRNWGVLFPDDGPASNSEIRQAREAEQARERRPLELFDIDAKRIESRVKRVARDRAFRERVLTAYESKCCVTGESLRAESGLLEVEAAHIVPRRLLGADDVRNGLALSSRLHWAFDNGLFGIAPDRRVFVPDRIARLPENTPLLAMRGLPLRETVNVKLNASSEALAWHFNHFDLGQ